MSLVVWARPLLAEVGGPEPHDYSGFMDTAGTAAGYASDPEGPLCGTPQVGFAPPNGPAVNTRLTGTGQYDGNFIYHWSATDPSDPELNPEHRWFTGTDDDDYFGFFTIDPAIALYAGFDEGHRKELYCLYPALSNTQEIVDVRLRGIPYDWEPGAPWAISYGHQSDGWFNFRVRVHSGNAPDLGCAACQCGGSPVECTCTGGNTMPLLFQVTMGASPTYGPSAYLNESYDWNVMVPVYRVFYGTTAVLGWTRAKRVYAHPEYPEQVIFAADLPGWCSVVSSSSPCRVEVAQMQPYTIRDRDKFIDETVEPFCDTSPYCEVYRGLNPPPGLSAPFGTGGLGYIDNEEDEGTAEQNDLVVVEFHPHPENEPAQNIIYVVAGDDYEPNGMYVGEGLINALMDDEKLLDGDETNNYEPVSFAILFGSDPDNLSWGITHVRPYGTGTGRLWYGAVWGFESLDWATVTHENDAPEAEALRDYYRHLVDRDLGEKIGTQVAALVGLHGDIAPKPDRWAGACALQGGDYFFPPPYGQWHFDGMAEPNGPADPAAFYDTSDGSDALAYVRSMMNELAEYLRDPNVPGGSPLSRYFRPLSQWWPHKDSLSHNYEFNGGDFSTDPDLDVPILLTFEFDETGLYLHQSDLDAGIQEPCAMDIVPAPNCEDFHYCMQGYIDNMDVYRQWGKTLAYGLRHTLHDLPTLPIDCSEP